MGELAASLRAAAAPALLLALLAAGGWSAARLARAREERLPLTVLAGAVLLHLVLGVATLAGIGWSLAWVVGPPALAFAGTLLAGRRRGRRGGSPGAGAAAPSPASSPALPPALRPGWGDALAALGVVAFAALSWTRWIAVSDFAFHWGLKGHRFLIAGGIDFAYLARPWNWPLHPDYPNLVPEVYAATGLLGGGWSEPPVLLWSAIFLALLLLASRAALAAGTLGAGTRHAVLGALGMVLAAFGILHVMAGAADWPLALALMAALPALLREPDAAGDLQVGLAAAFAAGCKLEGLTLAAWLLLVQLLRRPPRAGRELVRRGLALGLPVAAVVGLWADGVLRHDLFQPFNSGTPELARALAALPALARELATPAWHGAPLALLLLPFLLARRNLRAPALVIALQLATYLYQYVSAPADTAQLVATTFARLLLHLLPALLVLAALRWLGEPPANGAEAAAGLQAPAGAASP